MSKFNLQDTFAQESSIHSELENQTYQSTRKTREKVFYYKDLIANEKNRTINHEKVLSIAESIVANGRMIDKPQVTLLENGQGLLWAGHHRTSAITYLVEEKGMHEFEYIKCDILENNVVDNEILMIDTNLEREELSLYDKMMAIGRKEELYRLKKKNNELNFSGSARAYIASASNNLEETQVGVHLRIYKKAAKAVKNALKEDKITLTQAYQLSAFDEQEQKVKLKEILSPKKSIQKEMKALDTYLESIRLKLEADLQTKVQIKKGYISFGYSSLEELNQLLNTLGLETGECNDH